ncbi:hypothetical protein E8E11_007544 [Didymella keratinophila]|nr:hypothetical protein E8E11_007544 [Didymella keratinophila]
MLKNSICHSTFLKSLLDVGASVPHSTSSAGMDRDGSLNLRDIWRMSKQKYARLSPEVLADFEQCVDNGVNANTDLTVLFEKLEELAVLEGFKKLAETVQLDLKAVRQDLEAVRKELEARDKAIEAYKRQEASSAKPTKLLKPVKPAKPIKDDSISYMTNPNHAQVPPNSPASPTFQNDYPPLTLPLLAKMLRSPSKWNLSLSSSYSSEELKKMKTVYQPDGRVIYFHSEVFYFDPAEIPGDGDGKVIWDTICKMRGGDVANKLFISVYKAQEPEPEPEPEAEAAPREEHVDAKEEIQGELWQDPETGVFWAGGKKS